MISDGQIDPKHLIDSGQDATATRHSGFVAEASHSDGVSSFVVREKKPLRMAGVPARARHAGVAARPDLLRIKGLLNLEGSKGPVVFQAVQHLIHPPVELAEWPDKDRSSRLVFITRDVSEKQVRDLLDACKALASSAASRLRRPLDRAGLADHVRDARPRCSAP